MTTAPKTPEPPSLSSAHWERQHGHLKEIVQGWADYGKEFERKFREVCHENNKLRAALASRAEPPADPLIGGCIDGGTCHHECVVSDGCFRKKCCVPLTASGLGDDWKPKARAEPPVLEVQGEPSPLPVHPTERSGEAVQRAADGDRA